jgi:hypothetical protein
MRWEALLIALIPLVVVIGAAIGFYYVTETRISGEDERNTDSAKTIQKGRIRHTR